MRKFVSFPAGFVCTSDGARGESFLGELEDTFQCNLPLQRRACAEVGGGSYADIRRWEMGV